MTLPPLPVLYRLDIQHRGEFGLGWIIGWDEWAARSTAGTCVALLSGGPLDAPEYMPAGSTLGSRGRPVQRWFDR